MITEKKISLKPLLESSEGIHLTVYLVNRGDLIDLKSQLRETLSEASESLHSAQTVEERKKFLEPLETLLHDARIFKRMKGNVGIFRTKDSFRVLNVPVELERQCHVASSFHVKPLLRWMQLDREFLLLGLKADSAELYLGNQTSLQKVDAILFPEFFKEKETINDYLSLKKSRQLRLKQDETFSWLSEWLEQVTQKSTPRLFLAGEKSLVDGLLKNLKYKNVTKNPVAHSFGNHNLRDVCQNIRKTLKAEAKKTLEYALMEFRFAEELNFAKKNIFQIAKAAIQGRIKKLIIADGINVFGKVDKKTGGLAIHPADLDHEDDDILDDLAQTVLVSGGEVVVAPREEIPKGRPILAILEHQGTGLEKNEFQVLSERIS
ncbi:MAG: hypothetical protein A4S09_04760 [Proteobacteria bacterium SG_bin7]|nr:MAG: hypothetical protein A4S09_04760 [Proteobacteria bacterium SG_bin7]